MRGKCSVPGCVSIARNTKMHRFANPRNYERYKRWIEVIKSKELEALPAEVIYNSHLICHNHFEPIHYTRNGRLYAYSVPTLNLPTSVADAISKRKENHFVGMSAVQHFIYYYDWKIWKICS